MAVVPSIDNNANTPRAFTVDRLFNPGVDFSFANFFNTLITGNPVAIKIAIAKLAAACVIAGTQIGVNRLPDDSRIKKHFKAASAYLNDQSDNRSTLKRGFQFIGKQLTDPLRITAYCAAAIGSMLIVGSGGAVVPVIQGLAFLSFSVGNFIQSSPALKALTEKEDCPRALKAILHPALWYGIGYTGTGFAIAGGTSVLGNTVATLFTAAGVTEIIASLWMSTRKVSNKAGPFVGVAIGTASLVGAGIATGNIAGAACAAFACKGETGLAILTQQAENRNALKTGVPVRNGILTRPLQWAMNKLGIPKCGA